MGALEKLIRGTAWGTLDVLFVDMPPGAPHPAPLRYIHQTRRPWLRNRRHDSRIGIGRSWPVRLLTVPPRH